MYIYSDKLTRADLDAIADRMPVILFDTDNEFSGARRRRIKVSLRPSSADKGEQWRKVKEDQFTGRLRRIYAISWNGHYVFYAALLALDPAAEIKSVLAHWRGRADYYARVSQTGDANWGSAYMPQYARYMCHELIKESELKAIGEAIAAEINPDLPMQPISETNGAVTYSMRQEDMRKCPHYIIAPEHYRADGSCRCDDESDPNMPEWGYTFTNGAWR